MSTMEKKIFLRRAAIPAFLACAVFVLAAGIFVVHKKSNVEAQPTQALAAATSTSSHSMDMDGMKGTTIADATPEAQRPMRDKLIAMLDPKDPNTIFKVVDTIQADPNLSQNCHEMAHDIGRAAYTMYGFSDAMTFNNPNHVKHALVQYICAGGYMHGILEQMSVDQPDFLKQPEIICDQVSAADRDSCFHGMGHVFMLAHDRDVSAAISGCRVIKNLTDMYRCFEGVRMEQFWGTAELSATTTLGWDPANPLATCIAAVQDERPTCFLYSSFGYLRVHPKDYSGAAQLCTESNLADLDSEFCLKGLGMTMMSKFKGKNMEGSEVYVDGFADDKKYAFYQGVTGYAHLSGVSVANLETACGLLVHDSLICLSALDGYK
jgi:hypothetical protein